MSEPRPLPTAFISKAEHRDEEAIVAIDRACFSQVTINVKGELERPWAHVWVARRDPASAPVSFMLVWLVADELHVLSLATLPECQRQGWARTLLVHALEFARARRVRLLLLEVRRSNSSAIQLYRRFGFSAVGIRPRYYADNFEDAIEMTLELDEAGDKIVRREDEVRF